MTMRRLLDMVERIFRMDQMRGFRRLGRRGIVLLLFGCMWVCYGLAVAVITEQPIRFSGRKSFPVLGLLDTRWAGLVWIASGVLSIVIGLTRMWRHGRDTAGFNALLAPAFLWSLASAWSLGLWFVTSGEYGRSTALASLVIWAAVCAFVILAAGWPDPDDPAFRVHKPSETE